MTIAEKLRSLYNISIYHKFVLWSSLILSIALPRFFILGGYPYTDEGSYAYLSQLVYNSLFNPSYSEQSLRYEIYPTFFSWIYAFNVNQFVIFRFIDLWFAILTGYLIFKNMLFYNKNYYTSLVLSFIINFTINLPAFINNGFKNSIFFSLSFFLLSILILNKPSTKLRDFYFIGFLSAISILSREPFIVYFFGITIFIFLKFNMIALRNYVMSFILSFVLVTFILLLIRNTTVFDLIMSYYNMKYVYSSFNAPINFLFFESLKQVISQAEFLLWINLIIIILSFSQLKQIKNYQNVFFFILLIALSFIEPLFKACFPYHFITILIFFSILSSILLSNLNYKINLIKPITSIVLIIFLFYYYNIEKVQIGYYESVSKQNIFSLEQWSQDSIKHSQYLRIAEVIKKSSNDNDRIIISGFMYPLFPLSNRLPPSHELADLNVLFAKLEYDPLLLKNKINGLNPKLIFITDRIDFKGTETIQNIVQSMPHYQLLKVFSNDSSLHYGNFSGKLFIRKE